MRYLLIALLCFGCMPASKKALDETRITLYDNSKVDRAQSEILEANNKIMEQVVMSLNGVITPEQYQALLKNCAFVQAQSDNIKGQAIVVENTAGKQTKEDTGIVSKGFLEKLVSISTILAKALNLPLGTTESLMALALLGTKWWLDKKKHAADLVDAKEKAEILKELPPEIPAAYDAKKKEIRARKLT